MVKAKTAKICVVQVKSQTGCDEKQRANLKGLGLGKIGKKVVLKDDGCIRGMIKKVSHLVKVEGADE